MVLVWWLRTSKIEKAFQLQEDTEPHRNRPKLNRPKAVPIFPEELGKGGMKMDELKVGN